MGSTPIPSSIIFNETCTTRIYKVIEVRKIGLDRLIISTPDYNMAIGLVDKMNCELEN